MKTTLSFDHPKTTATTIAYALLIFFFAGCGLQKPDTRLTQDELLMKEGLPLPSKLHGTWSLNYEASKGLVEKRASDAEQRNRWLTALEEASGSSMEIDAETWRSITIKGTQKFEAALLSPAEDPRMLIGLDAYKALATLRILSLNESELILASETNPMMQHFVWER